MDLAYADLPRAPTGRPSKFTPEIIGKLLTAISKGNRIVAACKSAGVSYEAYIGWVHRGEAGEEPYAQFVQDVHKAEGESELTLVDSLTSAGHTDWHAHAWLLARRHGWVDESKRPQAGSTSTTTVNIAVLSMDMLPGIAGLLGAPSPDQVIDTTSQDVGDILHQEDM